MKYDDMHIDVSQNGVFLKIECDKFEDADKLKKDIIKKDVFWRQFKKLLEIITDDCRHEWNERISENKEFRVTTCSNCNIQRVNNIE